MERLKNGVTPKGYYVQLEDHSPSESGKPFVVAIQLPLEGTLSKRYTYSYATKPEAEITYAALLMGANPRSIRGLT